MFAVTVSFTIDPAHYASFLTLITCNAAQSLKNEPDCHRFDVCTDDDGTVFLYELYTDAAAFDVHKTMAHYAEFTRDSASMVRDKAVKTYHLEPLPQI